MQYDTREYGMSRRLTLTDADEWEKSKAANYTRAEIAIDFYWNKSLYP